MTNSEDRPPKGFVLIPDRAEIERSAGPFYQHVMDDGVRRLGFRVTHRKLNNMGVCHGGVLAMFADIQAIAIKKRLGITADTPTVNLGMDFVAPARAGDWVWSQPELVSHTDGMIFLRATVHSENTVCMQVNGIYLAKSQGASNQSRFNPS